MRAAPEAVRPVPHGPRAYRARLRTIGPVAALLPATALGLLSLLILHGSHSVARGGGAFALAVLAAPLLLVLGVPLTSGGGVYLVAIAGSATLWLLLGVLASRLATRSPAASWRDFVRELVWLTAGVWLGVGGALLVADLILGRALF